MGITSISENVAIGTTVSTQNSSEPDTGDTSFGYAEISGTGDTDNNQFAIEGITLVTDGKTTIQKRLMIKQ